MTDTQYRRKVLNFLNDISLVFDRHGFKPVVTAVYKRSITHQYGISFDITNRPADYESLSIMLKELIAIRASKRQKLEEYIPLFIQSESNHWHITIALPG